MNPIFCILAALEKPRVNVEIERGIRIIYPALAGRRFFSFFSSKEKNKETVGLSWNT